MCFPLGYDENGKEVYDDEDWYFAKLGTTLPYGTKIKISDRSGIMLSYPNMIVFTSDEDGVIVLDVDPAVDPDRPTQFKLLWGTLKVNVKRILKDGSMDIEMSQAVAGIKGTTFVLEDDGQTSTLKVIEGMVEFTSMTTGESVMVEGGKMVSATADGLGDIEEFDGEAETAKWAEYGTEMPSEGFPLWAILAIAGGVLVIV